MRPYFYCQPKPTLATPPFFKELLLLVLPLFAAAAVAQPVAKPVQPAAPMPLAYTSPLRAYRAYSDQTVQPWREANDLVGRIGGWRSYAKEGKNEDIPNDVTTQPESPAGPRYVAKP